MTADTALAASHDPACCRRGKIMRENGKTDGVYVSTLTETKHFIYFYLGHCAILLFKTQ